MTTGHRAENEEQLICPTHKVKDCSCPEWAKFIDTRIYEGKTKLVFKATELENYK